MSFKKAERKGIWVRLALDSPSGGGKTWTGLTVATELAKKFNYKIAVIDTEKGSASKYADYFDFDVLELDTFEVEKYIGAINDAEKNGYKVLLIDSLSHAWTGVGGILDRHDSATKRSKSGNSYNAWREVTPLHNKLIDAILNFNGHVIVTMRTKTEYLVEVVNGKSVPRKVGMAPIQRDGMEYEFDIVGDMDLEHNLIISKTRCHPLADKVFKCPGQSDTTFTDILCDWVGGQEPAKKEVKKETATPAKAERTTMEKIADGSKALSRCGVSDDDMARMYDEYFPETTILDATEEQRLAFLEVLRKEYQRQTQTSTPEATKRQTLPKIYDAEKRHYPLKKVVDAARKKHLNGKDPKDCSWDELGPYWKNLQEKDNEALKKKAS